MSQTNKKFGPELLMNAEFVFTICAAVVLAGANVVRGTIRTVLALLLLAIPALVQAQIVGSGDGYNYISNVSDTNTITVTGYFGPAGAINIPTNINGLTVSSIGNGGTNDVFAGTGVTIVVMGSSVSSIGAEAFEGCASLASVTSIADSFNVSGLQSVTFDSGVTSICASAFEGSSLHSITIPDSVTNIGADAFAGTFLTSITIGNSVTSIGDGAFIECAGLTNVTIPASVTSIAKDAFNGCTGLEGIYFEGNAPTVTDPSESEIGNHATIYYLDGTTGWSSTFETRPTVLWNPVIQTGVASLGVSNNQFGFTITNGSITNIPIVVEACTNLASPVWIPLQALTLSNSFYFSDPDWTNYPARYYGLSFP
jgi:hypothetical protein